jgi:hypothetical protein
MCNKIGYFLQVVHKIDIVRMDVQFFQDECGATWLYSAQNIWIRLLENHKQLRKKEDAAAQQSQSGQTQKKHEKTEQAIHSEAKLFKKYQFMEILREAIDRLYGFQKEEQQEDLFDFMEEFN